MVLRQEFTLSLPTKWQEHRYRFLASIGARGRFHTDHIQLRLFLYLVWEFIYSDRHSFLLSEPRQLRTLNSPLPLTASIKFALKWRDAL
jgi:hypothetical protein